MYFKIYEYKLQAELQAKIKVSELLDDIFTCLFVQVQEYGMGEIKEKAGALATK